jgi:AcrR family transcriptional regulator
MSTTPARYAGRSVTRLTREEQKARTRSALLEAASKVFARRGLHAASVEEVAEAAGFSKGAVYANFESKEALFLALLDQNLEDRMAEIRRNSGDDSEPGDQLRATGDDWVAFINRDPEWAMLFFEFWAYSLRNPEFRTELVARYRKMRGSVAELIERRTSQLGLELPVPAEKVAVMTFAMANGIAFEKLLEPDAVSDDIYPSMLNLLFLGLAALRDGAILGAGTPPR